MPFSFGFIFGLIGTLLVGVYFVSATLTINNIDGPEYVEENKTDEIILDCDFDAVDEQDIVVKWFYNGLNEMIFQWIADQDRAQVIGPIKEYLDPTYYVITNNATMYRALRFKKVDRSISGNYTCKVSTDRMDRWMTKPLVVYSPPTSFEFNQIVDNGVIVTLCDASNVSPKPIFDITIDSSNVDISDGLVSNRKESEDDYGYFNQSIELSVNSSYLMEPLTVFSCSLSIPGTNYTIVKYYEYNIENFEDSSSSNNITTEDIYHLFHDVNSTEGYSVFDNGNNITKFNGILRLQPAIVSSLLTVIIIYFIIS